MFVCPESYSATTACAALQTICISMNCDEYIIFMCPEYTPNPNCNGAP
jgi:hypothetical protein